jgi:hypothetical protein
MKDVIDRLSGHIAWYAKEGSLERALKRYCSTSTLLKLEFISQLKNELPPATSTQMAKVLKFLSEPRDLTS